VPRVNGRLAFTSKDARTNATSRPLFTQRTGSTWRRLPPATTRSACGGATQAACMPHRPVIGLRRQRIPPPPSACPSRVFHGAIAQRSRNAGKAELVLDDLGLRIRQRGAQPVPPGDTQPARCAACASFGSALGCAAEACSSAASAFGFPAGSVGCAVEEPALPAISPYRNRAISRKPQHGGCGCGRWATRRQPLVPRAQAPSSGVPAVGQRPFTQVKVRPTASASRGSPVRRTSAPSSGVIETASV